MLNLYTPKSPEWKHIVSITKELFTDNSKVLIPLNALSYSNTYKINFAIYNNFKILKSYGYFELQIPDLTSTQESEFLTQESIDENPITNEISTLMFNYQVNQPSITKVFPNKSSKNSSLTFVGSNFNENNLNSFVQFTDLNLNIEFCPVINVLNTYSLEVLSPKNLTGPLYIQYIDNNINKSGTIFGLYENL